MSPWLEVVVLAVMVVGLVGLVFPVLPGLALMWVAVLGWVLLDGGGLLRWLTFAIVTLLAILGTAAATWLSGRRAADAGAPWWVLLVGTAGMIVGFFLIPVLGLVIGGVGAIWLAETVRRRDPRLGWETTWAALQGYGVGTLVQVAAGVAALAVWLVAVVIT